MVATSVAVVQHVFSVPMARALQGSRSFRIICSRRASTSSSSPGRSSQVDSRVLLGMSESELQQLSVDLGQQSYRGKQLHHLIYQRKVKEIQDFSQLPQAFRHDLQQAGWRVGRSPIYHTVTAADGTVKVPTGLYCLFFLWPFSFSSQLSIL
uniref:Uncharacterized protein LOC105647614 isoform X1 n=1 Tax=Rhizophora mucronata TaxID=61149 RepID=A0A2P2LBG8_RHIMU